ncbi:hypothetical protein NEOKW01_1543 [Nematocida sp. AWRm80]|nr:hypothetical protein NEOKW01_1543 [Nematocida sp. AWRm80]
MSVIEIGQRLYVRKEHVVCHTNCGRVIKIRLKRAGKIRPAISIKYSMYLSKRIDHMYTVPKSIARLSKDSKVLLETILGCRVNGSGILMHNLKTPMHTRVFLKPLHLSFWKYPQKTSFPDYSLIPMEFSSGDYDKNLFKSISIEILKQEQIIEKISKQQTLYDKYGQDHINTLFSRYFGCYRLKKKCAGIKPFILKGQWTRDKAEDCLYSYKTASSLRESSFFINIHSITTISNNTPSCIPLSSDKRVYSSDTPLRHRNKTLVYHSLLVEYSIALYKIDLLPIKSFKRRLVRPEREFLLRNEHCQ